MSNYDDFDAVPSPLCPRCGIGIDDNGDGDCSVCASASNRLVGELSAVRGRVTRKELELHETTLLLDAAKKSRYSIVVEALEKAAGLVDGFVHSKIKAAVERIAEDYR